jgi:predicted alpha/beta hydrolase family esterase
LNNKKKGNLRKAAEKGESCLFPRSATSFSSVEELTLSKEDLLLKFLKRLNASFKIPVFSQEVLEDAIPDLIASFNYFSHASLNKIPELFFRVPDSVPLICVSSPVSLSSGEVSELSFRSAFEPMYPEYKERLAKEPRWNAVRAKYWKHVNEESHGTIIAIHAWMMGDEKASALTLVPGFFYRMGLDVIVFELPFHGSRRPEKFLPLKMFPGIDAACTNESFAQAIYELRGIREWLKRENDKPVIGVGLSLGAQVLSLWSSLDRLDAAICVAPLVSLADFIWAQVEGAALAERLVSAGISRQLLEAGFSVSSPLSYPLAMEKEKVLIIAGKHDEIVPSSHAEALWNHWQRPSIHWLDKGHIEQLVTEGTAGKVHAFLKERGLADPQLRKIVRL